MMKLSKHLIIFILLWFHQSTIIAQCCEYKLSMQDSYGDSWNGASLEILINNSSIGSFSAINSGSFVTIPICTGDSLHLIYTSGSYENENTYQLQDSSWNIVFQDGPNPATGLVFQAVGNCSTPLLLGSHPCNPIPIDTGQCYSVNNTGYPGSGLAPNCGNYVDGDLWFSLDVPPSGNLSLETLSGSIDDTGIAVWTGLSCNSPTLIACDDDNGAGYLSFLLLYDLTPGETIFVQAWKWGGGSGSFQLCVEDVGKVNLDSSELPIVMINTLGQTIVENSKIDGLMDIKYNGIGNLTYLNDPSNIYSGHIGISIRGLSSAGYPQHPYSVETRDALGNNNNVPILGMPDENDWVLLSNYNDRTLIKNVMSLKLFGEMGNYSPRAQLCEVLIDSAYQGIYVIGEKIKRDNNRVNIANLLTSDISGDELTGGYILQQNYWNANNSFQSNFSPIDHPGFDVHFVYDSPDEFAIQPQQKTYIASYIDSLETALYSAHFDDPINGYRKYLDVKSFIDYFIVNELARNADGFKKSVFFHKDKYSNGGKLKAGPVWDFDWAWKNLGGVCYLYEGYTGAGWAHQNNNCPTDNYSTGWYVRLLQDSTFRNELRCTYEIYRQAMLDTTQLFAYIDQMGELVTNAQERHFKKWPILGMSGPAPDFGPVAETYYAELDSLKSWIGTRINWLDNNIPGLCASTGIKDNIFNSVVNCYPNPANDYIMVDYMLSYSMNVSYQLYDYLGNELYTNSYSQVLSGKHTITIPTNELSEGIYLLKFTSGTDTIIKKISIVHD